MPVRSSVAAVLSVLLILPASLLAAEFDFLLEDLDVLELEMQADEADEQQIEIDEAYEADEMLFPAEAMEDDAQSSARTVENISSTHVWLRFNNLPVILQDVPVSQWFAPYVRDIAERGIITGYKDAQGTPTGSFGPDDQVTIEQLAKITVESAEVDRTKCPAEPLNEAAKGRWSAPYFSCAEFLRWLVYSEGTVDPTRPANRMEVVMTLLQAFNRDLERATGKIFKDVSASMPNRDFIETAALDGIISGYSDAQGVPTGYFGPFDPVNRAATAKIVSLSIQVYGY